MAEIRWYKVWMVVHEEERGYTGSLDPLAAASYSALHGPRLSLFVGRGT